MGMRTLKLALLFLASTNKNKSFRGFVCHINKGMGEPPLWEKRPSFIVNVVATGFGPAIY